MSNFLQPQIDKLDLSTTPKHLPIDETAIPNALKKGSSFLLWSFDNTSGKWTKPPLLRYAQHKNLLTFDQCAKACNDDLGMGIVLKSANLTALDFDNVLDQNGELVPKVAFVEPLLKGLWVTVSPSGKGLRVFSSGASPEVDGWKKNPLLEVFDCTDTRYMAVTSDVWKGHNSSDLAPKGLVSNIMSAWVNHGLCGRTPQSKMGKADEASAAKIRNGDYAEIERMLAVLDGTQYEDWLDVCAQLHTIFKGSNTGCRKFADWSLRFKNDNESEEVCIINCEKLWRNMQENHPNPQGIGSMRRNYNLMLRDAFNVLQVYGDVNQAVDSFNSAYGIVYQENTMRVYSAAYGTYHTDSVFSKLHAEKKVSINGKLKPAVREWYNDPHRNSYEAVVFDPNLDAFDGYNERGIRAMNLYTPLHVPDGGHEDGVELVKELLSIVTGGEDDHIEFLLNSIAYKIQKPWQKPGSCVILRGDEGVGKGLVGQLLNALFGGYYLHVANKAHLVGNFNALLSSRLIVFADEAVFNKDHQTQDMLKSIITEPTVIIEHKGVDSVSARNYINVWMATNSDSVVNANLDSRRFFVCTAGEKKSKAWYRSWHDKMFNQGGWQVVHRWLADRRLNSKDIDLLGAPPKTAGFYEQVESSKDSVELFWLDMFEDRSILNSAPSRGKFFKDTATDAAVREKMTLVDVQGEIQEICIHKPVLHKVYLEWCSKGRVNQYDVEASNVHFGRRTSKMYKRLAAGIHKVVGVDCPPFGWWFVNGWRGADWVRLGRLWFALGVAYGREGELDGCCDGSGVGSGVGGCEEFEKIGGLRLL